LLVEAGIEDFDQFTQMLIVLFGALGAVDLCQVRSNYFFEDVVRKRVISHVLGAQKCLKTSLCLLLNDGLVSLIKLKNHDDDLGLDLHHEVVIRCFEAT
jgi:hypothetical protein